MFRITFWWPMSLVVKKRGQTVATRAAREGNVNHTQTTQTTPNHTVHTQTQQTTTHNHTTSHNPPKPTQPKPNPQKPPQKPPRPLKQALLRVFLATAKNITVCPGAPWFSDRTSLLAGAMGNEPIWPISLKETTSGESI